MHSIEAIVPHIPLLAIGLISEAEAVTSKQPRAPSLSSRVSLALGCNTLDLDKIDQPYFSLPP